MSTEQSFSSQVEAVMQRGRRGEQNPNDTVAISAIETTIQQQAREREQQEGANPSREIAELAAHAQSAGEAIMAQMMGTSATWQAAINILRNTDYKGDYAMQEVLDRAERALPTVAREGILESRQIPTNLSSVDREQYRDPLEVLRRDVKSLTRRRMFASLTDPNERPGWYRSVANTERFVKTSREDVLRDSGIGAPGHINDPVNTWMERAPKSEEWQEIRANNRVLTEAMIARFLDGSVLAFDRLSGRHNTNIDYSAPTHEALSNPAIRTKYRDALVLLVDGLDTDTDWNEDERKALKEKKGGWSEDLVIDPHEAFVSHLFDGIAFQGNLAPGVGLRAKLGHHERSDPDGARTASFARGVALRILVEGGDAMSYTVAVGTLPDKDKGRLAEVARQILASTQDASEQARLKQLLREAHGDQAQEAGPDGADITSVERAPREAMAQQARQATREQLERRMLTTSINSLRSDDLPGDLQSALERSTGDVPGTMQEIGKNLAWANAVEGIFMQELGPELERYVDGAGTLSDFTDHATQLHHVLDRLSEITCTDSTLSMSTERDRAPLEPNMQRVLVLARLAGLLLSEKYIENQMNMGSLMVRALHHAQSLGVSQEDVLGVYNRTIVAVAKHNQAVATIAPDCQIQMQDGLAYALQRPREWKVTNSYNSPMIALPEWSTGNDVDAPGITSYDVNMQSGARSAQRISMIHLRESGRSTENDHVIEREANAWAKERILPLEQTVGDVRRARGYPETARMLVNTSAKHGLERSSYDPPRESAKIPDNVGSSIAGVEGGVRNLRHLAELDTSEKARGAVAEQLLQGITNFQTQHGDELANPPKAGPFTRHTKGYQETVGVLTDQVKSTWARLGMQGKPPAIDTPASLVKLEDAIRQKETESENADLTVLRQALGALDQAIPSPEDRALRFLEEYTQPPYEPSTGHAVVDVIKIPSSQAKAIYNGKAEYPVRELLADPKLSNSVAQALVRGCIVYDHGWSKPIHDRVKALRAAAKSNAPGTGLSEEVNNALFAVEGKLTVDPGVAFYVDGRPIADAVLKLMAGNLRPLLGDATLSTIDASVVASVGGGKLKEKLDQVVVNAKRDHKEAAELLGT